MTTTAYSTHFSDGISHPYERTLRSTTDVSVLNGSDTVSDTCESEEIVLTTDSGSYTVESPAYSCTTAGDWLSRLFFSRSGEIVTGSSTHSFSCNGGSLSLTSSFS